MSSAKGLNAAVAALWRDHRIALISLVGVLGITLLAGWRLSERLATPEVLAPPPLQVETETVSPQQMVIRASYSGTIEAEQRITIASRLTSTVIDRRVSEGQQVAAGETLLQLDATEQQQELARLAAAAARIQADLDYWDNRLRVDQRLFREGTISEQNLKDTRRQVAALRASLEENQQSRALAQTRLGYATVTAPFAGVVQSVPVNPGDTVSAGAPLLELVDQRQLKAVVRAPQSDHGRLTPGLPVYLRLHRLATGFKGEVRRIYPALEPVSRNLTLDIPLPDSQRQVQPGMSVTAEIELERLDSALSVPLHALQRRNGQEGVFVLRGNAAHWQAVRAGRIQGGRVELLDGIAAGAQVITTPYPALQSGSPVRIDSMQATRSAG